MATRARMRSDLAPTPTGDAALAGSPFHEGERSVQQRLGVRDRIEPWARRVVRPFLPDEHRDFYARLPFLVGAARDGAGRPWATLLEGEPGFVRSPNARTLRIDARPPPGDALDGALREGADVGVLGIELESRRRNRANGRLAASEGGVLDLFVDQSFGNCPQHITERRWQRAPVPAGSGRTTRARELSAAQRAFIGRADTFFIATGFRGRGQSEAFGMDASHRGGAPGFVHVASGRTLVFPDYAGNDHFNTIGNLLVDPRAGLLFVDFERGSLLQLSGRAHVDWDSPEVAHFAGARRLVRFEVEECVENVQALALRWEAPGASVRELRVIARQRESDEVVSFVLASRDGGALAPFAAGQHLPVELDLPGHSAPLRRSYSLSGAPGKPFYRISVKRDARGLVSRHLHDAVREGAGLRASAPRGDFVLDAASGRPVVLVSAGVGLTPLVSMLHALAARERSARPPVVFVHGTRDGAHHALREEVEECVVHTAGFRLHVAYSRPRPQDVARRDFQSEGRVDAALLESLVPGLAADFYLCGPIAFMAQVEAGLEARGVPRAHIHSESFGSAA